MKHYSKEDISHYLSHLACICDLSSTEHNDGWRRIRRAIKTAMEVARQEAHIENIWEEKSAEIIAEQKRRKENEQ